MIESPSRTSAPWPTSPTLSAQLRDQTRDEHAAAEDAFALDVRLASFAAYGTLLVTLRRLYAPLEQALGVVTGWDRLTPSIDPGSRRRTALIDVDLGALGISPLPTVRPRATLPRLTSFSRALGCLYVLEGSTLGGRIVARRARVALGPQCPVAFFSCANSDHLGDDWRALQAALDAFGRSAPAVSTEVIGAARETFAAMRRGLDLGLAPA